MIVPTLLGLKWARILLKTEAGPSAMSKKKKQKESKMSVYIEVEVYSDCVQRTTVESSVWQKSERFPQKEHQIHTWKAIAKELWEKDSTEVEKEFTKLREKYKTKRVKTYTK